MNELEQQAIQSLREKKNGQRARLILLSNEKYTGMRFLILRKEMWSIFLRISYYINRNIPDGAA